MQVTIDSKQVERVFRAYPEASVNELSRLLVRGGITVQRALRENAPTHDGQLRRSITYKLNRGRLEVAIGPTVDYAAAVEKGSKPHWTSVKEGTPLRKWADDHHINPYALQYSIAQKGTKATNFVRDTKTEVENQVTNQVLLGFGQFIARVDAGAI